MSFGFGDLAILMSLRVVGNASTSFVARSIYVTTKQGLAEPLKDSPKSAPELAQVISTNPRALYRALRALASIGIFAEEQGYFVLTPLAECLLDPSTKAIATSCRPGHE